MFSMLLALSLVAPPAAKEAPKVADKPTAAPFYDGVLKEEKGKLVVFLGKPKDEVYEVVTLVFKSRDAEAEAKKLVGERVRVIGREGFANGETFVLVTLMREVPRK
jgi:hypothetical protein